MMNLQLMRAIPSSKTQASDGHDDFPQTARRLPQGQQAARLRRLADACELLADGFDGFDEHIAAFVACTPTPTRRSGLADADHFLDWLAASVDLNDEQRDYVADVRSRHAVELVAVRQRLAHVRFQDLLLRSERYEGELATNRRLTIRINPIHVWSQFETRVLLDDETEIPATVLFFPVDGCVRTLVVEPDAEALLRDLESGGVMTIADLLRRTPGERQIECLNLVRRLAGVGVIAIGT